MPSATLKIVSHDLSLQVMVFTKTALQYICGFCVLFDHLLQLTYFPRLFFYSLNIIALNSLSTVLMSRLSLLSSLSWNNFFYLNFAMLEEHSLGFSPGLLHLWATALKPPALYGLGLPRAAVTHQGVIAVRPVGYRVQSPWIFLLNLTGIFGNLGTRSMPCALPKLFFSWRGKLFLSGCAVAMEDDQ